MKSVLEALKDKDWTKSEVHPGLLKYRPGDYYGVRFFITWVIVFGLMMLFTWFKEPDQLVTAALCSSLSYAAMLFGFMNGVDTANYHYKACRDWEEAHKPKGPGSPS